MKEESSQSSQCLKQKALELASFLGWTQTLEYQVSRPALYYYMYIPELPRQADWVESYSGGTRIICNAVQLNLIIGELTLNTLSMCAMVWSKQLCRNHNVMMLQVQINMSVLCMCTEAAT